MDKELKELLDMTEQLEGAGVIPKDGPEYLYELILARAKERERAKRSQTIDSNNNKEVK